MEIKLGIGTDSIVFGMTKEYITKKFGKPDRINETEPKEGVIYYYNKFMVKLYFYQEDDYKLVSIENYNEESKLYNEFIIGKTMPELKELLENQGISDFSYEDWEIFDIMNCDEISASFEVLFNKIVSIQFNPFYDGNGDIIWPDMD